MAEDAKAREPRRRGASLAAIAVLALFAAWAVPAAWRGLAGGHPPGEVLFTGLDDSAQSMLARSLKAGAPLVYHDDAFAAVPPDVRPALLYRPGLPRKTRDLAHQLDPATCTARPFFQPFLPWQRAHLPGLPFALWFATTLALVLWTQFGTGRPRLLSLSSLIQAAVVWLAGFFLVPWIPRFAFGPFAEGPATLLSAFALALAFASPNSAVWGCATGLCLGLAATFHPTLAMFALPIALFAVLRRGAWRHTAALALGAVAGLAPLVWSTLCVTAPYGNFLDPAALRRMVAKIPDIRVLAVALAAALPLGIAGLALAHVPRLRAAMARPRARTAIAVACGATIALAVAAALLYPAAHRALSRDLDGIVLALPPLALAIAMGLRSRRPATCALLAGCAVASLPFLVIQGQEVHVGIWSLRRSLPPFAILFFASAFAAFELAPDELGRGPASQTLFLRLWFIRSAWLLLALLCSLGNLVRLPAGVLRGDETGSSELVFKVESRMGAAPGALYLFDYFSQGAPFVSMPGRDAFALNDATAKRLRHRRVVRWLRRECAKRPAYIVACSAVDEPILENGIALVPEGESVRGTVSRVDGKTFGTAQEVSRDLAFTFLRVRPATARDGTRFPIVHSPFGLAPGAWDEPRRGREGRWACDGAAFWGPIPKPGAKVGARLEVSWWTRDGTNAPPQRLWLETPFPGTAPEVVVPPGPGFVFAALHATRARDDTEPRPETGLYRIRAAERYDEKGFPPGLAVRVRSIVAATPAFVR